MSSVYCVTSLRGSQGSIENWLEPKSEPPSVNLARPNPWNVLYAVWRRPSSTLKSVCLFLLLWQWKEMGPRHSTNSQFHNIRAFVFLSFCLFILALFSFLFFPFLFYALFCQDTYFQGRKTKIHFCLLF
jgi:hypothetical protein